MKEQFKPFLKKAALSTAGFSAAISPVDSASQINYNKQPHYAKAHDASFATDVKYNIIGQESSQELETQGNFLKGFTYLEFGYAGLGDDLDEYRNETVGPILDRMKQDGANSVSYVFPYLQVGPFDSEMTNETDVTPKEDVIRAFIQEAHKRNMEVIMRPIMYLEDDSQYWRGQIQPSDPEKWFESHGKIMADYIKLAQEERVEYFSFGSELTSMEDPKYNQYWFNILDEASLNYDGEILFSINWGSLIYGTGVNAELLGSPAIDQIGLSYYYEHPDVPSGASPDRLLESMNNLPRYEIEALHDLTGKDIIIVEAGATSTSAPWQQPWNMPDGPIDQRDQSTYFQALCDAVVNNPELPYVVGVQTWTEGAVSLEIDPATHIGFEVFNKKAEQAVKDCFTEDK